MQDLQDLREYHDHLDATKRLEDDNRDDLIYTENNRGNWEGIRDGITAIEQIKALISIPEPLKQVLTTPGIITRDAEMRRSWLLRRHGEPRYDCENA